MKYTTPFMRWTILCLLLGTFTGHAFAQAEVEAWGNIKGIRIDGELMAFESSLRAVGADWSALSRTAKERQLPEYLREGDQQIVSTRLDSLFFTQVVEDSGPGAATVDIQFTSRADTSLIGAFFTITLPSDEYAGGSIALIDPAAVSLAETHPDGQDVYLRVPASGLRVTAARRQLEITAGEPTDIIIRKDPNQDDVQVYLKIASGALKKGYAAHKTFTIRATGAIDRAPITLSLDTSQPGRPFAGLGGNFRIQNPSIDPTVVQYSLDNLRVAWARVDMPWFLWQPEEDVDPTAAANANLNPRVRTSMEMAQKLSQRGIPVILSAWSGPAWALVGPLGFRPQPGGPRGNPLNPEKMDKIYASLTSYILYLKEHFGVEVEMFSFNESDLGINIRQTPEEHTRLIKGLGAYFASKGLKTKLLLGDTADANGYPFIDDAMADPATRPYIGAVSFHAWRGWATETLEKWADAAVRMDVPLLVGEGSIDAAAWRYPAIFEEPTYAMEEINLYTRILSICQPLSILQWQLTADYSALAGGGVFGNNEEPLHPTQRFWNLKQLSATPEGLFAMPIQCDNTDVTCAALGNNEKGIYTVHLVNNGATRKTTLTGLPDGVSALRIYVTDSERGMEEGDRIPVTDGQARFTLDAQSFTTLMSER